MTHKRQVPLRNIHRRTKVFGQLQSSVQINITAFWPFYEIWSHLFAPWWTKVFGHWSCICDASVCQVAECSFLLVEATTLTCTVSADKGTGTASTQLCYFVLLENIETIVLFEVCVPMTKTNLFKHTYTQKQTNDTN